MITSATDRAFLCGQFPDLTIRGLTDAELDQAIDAWFAHDHYAENPAYDYDHESSSDA